MYPTTTTILLTILILILFVRHHHHTRRLQQELLSKSRLEDTLTTTQRQYTSLQAIAAASHAKYIQLERQFLIKEDSYERRCRELESALAAYTHTHTHTQHDLRPFMLFAERLLSMNRVWQHQKSLDTLRTSNAQRKKAIHENAFVGFRDRLILSNIIWRQQSRLSTLEAENTRLRRNLSRGITKAAKQMVLDTRREGLIEEFVLGLLGDLDVGRREMKELNGRYEEVWRDCRGLRRRVEEMELAMKARDVEREIGDDLEERLVQRLKEQQREEKALVAAVPRVRTVSQTKQVLVTPTRPAWRF